MRSIISALLLVLSLVGARSGSARDALISIMNSVGCDGEQIAVVDVTTENCYVLALDEEDFASVRSAAVASGGDGSRNALIFASDKMAARRLYDAMWKNFEFPACDASEAIAFLKSGDSVAFFKGSDEDVEAYCRAYGDAFGAEAMKMIKNPAK